MSLTPNNVSYHDLTSLQQIRSNSGKDEKAALRQAAEQFESIFFSMLLSSMRKANEAFEVDGMMNSQTTKFYRDMHDSQMATDLAQKGALGLADLLVEQLSPALSKKATPDIAQVNETKTLQMPRHILPTVKVAKQAVMPTDTAIATAAPTGLAAANNIATAQPEVVKPAWQVASPEQFVRALLPAARETAKALGLDPLALIAQAALETGWGQRVIKTAKGESSFNLFGIKANNGWQGETAVVDTLEYRAGIAKKEQAKFRSYTSPEHSLQDYADFIKKNPRYQDAVQATGDTKAYFEQLQAAGYATDPAYAQKIMAVYQSSAFDKVRQEQGATQDFGDSADE
ncbi:flagellar protein FlgJ [Rheinheimera pacifica]|uniref:Peptidoglycan hydrolase FlgJ n=1 Tax=Rheinheimera pacifica TaxID=173990 RepID=A0A1H6MKT2_9GAMM|nr:flagellar assembly peptidoglycan hydrolase FlgJ [Rheinheimera pacifica]SEH99840.1 flagellar protein FlgJ [Rheinheimera pacifica]